MKSFACFLFGRKAAGSLFAEFAIVAPLMAILVIAAINLSYLGYVNQAATNIANSGARAGSVAQRSPAGAAYAAASKAAAVGGMGDRVTVSVSGGGRPGATIVVSANWTVPCIIPLICTGGSLSGTTYSVFRQEGW